MSANLTLKSAMPDMMWPALPTVMDAQVLAIYRQLEQSQWWPQHQLRAYQGQQLLHLLQHARATVPHYRDMPLPLNGRGKIDWEAFRALPVLKREILQQDKTAFHSNDVPASDQPNVEFTTSGSTGMPVSVIWTVLANHYVKAVNLRFHVWHGSDPNGRQAGLRAVPMREDGSSTEPRGNTWYPLAACGENFAFNAALPLSQQIDWLKKENPDYLMTYPSNGRFTSGTIGKSGPAISAENTVGAGIDFHPINHMIPSFAHTKGPACENIMCIPTTRQFYQFLQLTQVVISFIPTG